MASLERGLTDLTSNLNNFVSSQREENKAQREEVSKLYGAIKEVGGGFTTSLESVKQALHERGKITGTFVLMLLTTGVSIIAIIGGFVHSYVSGRMDTVRAAQEQIRTEIAHVNSDLAHAKDALNVRVSLAESRLNDEVARALASDSQGLTERRVALEKLALMEQRGYDELKDELRRLRDKNP